MDAAQEVCTMNFLLILNKKNKTILGHLLFYLRPFHSPPKEHEFEEICTNPRGASDYQN